MKSILWRFLLIFSWSSYYRLDCVQIHSTRRRDFSFISWTPKYSQRFLSVFMVSQILYSLVGFRYVQFHHNNLFSFKVHLFFLFFNIIVILLFLLFIFRRKLHDEAFVNSQRKKVRAPKTESHAKNGLKIVRHNIVDYGSK